MLFVGRLILLDKLVCNKSMHSSNGCEKQLSTATYNTSGYNHHKVEFEKTKESYNQTLRLLQYYLTYKVFRAPLRYSYLNISHQLIKLQ